MFSRKILSIAPNKILTSSLRMFARMLLYFMGWSAMDNTDIQELTTYKYTVAIFPHTSYADFYIMILYMLAHPEVSKYLAVVVKPQPFVYAGRLLRYFGCIPSTRPDKRGGGAVDRIAEELHKRDDNTTLLISPKGTIVKAPWRSGYYHIARGLKAPLRVIGLDYEKHEVIFCPHIDESLGMEETEILLKQDVSTIVSYFPEDEIVETRLYDKSEAGLISNIGKRRVVGAVVGIVCCIFVCHRTLSA